MQSLTPILTVDAIEPCLGFWEEQLGFERSAEVPEGDHLGFVILSSGGAELMYQTTESIRGDLPALAGQTGTSMLYLKVDDLDAVEAKLGDAEVVMPRRTTFYGAQEIWVKEPGGHMVGFAQF